MFRRLLFNHHRFKRKWQKRSHTIRGLLFAKEEHRKFNPFRQEDIRGKRRQRLALTTFILVSISTVLLWMYHSTFQIRHIHISGLERIEQQEFFNAVNGILSSRRWYVFPARGYFFVEEEEVASIVANRFPLQSVHVEKIFPNVLSIQVQEKISTVIYDNGKQYSYVGVDGKVVEIVRAVGEEEWIANPAVPSSTERIHRPNVTTIAREMGDYPIVYDTSTKDAVVNQVVLEETFVQAIIDWFTWSRTLDQITFSYIVVQDEFGNAILKTKRGWEVRFRLDESSERQFRQLQVFLQEKSSDTNNFQYVDVRYPGRVYWQ